MTNHWIDLQHSDCILIQGSNAAENHPISFKWVLKAKDKGAEVIHVDPRFTRTSARSSMYAPLRSGTDIAFLGGMIKYILDHDLYFKDYVLSYTNAAFLVNPKFSFNDGLFSGYDAQKHAYDKSSWSFQKDDKGLIKRDDTLKNPHCVFQLMKKHYDRYDLKKVSSITGTPEADLLAVYKAFAATGKPDKAGTIMYALGQCHHSVAVQNIRTMTIVQLLLGNIGICGGGINALRGEPNVQGSTDHALLSHYLPGYLKAPKASWQTLEQYIAGTTPRTANPQSLNWMSNTGKYVTSLMRAFYPEGGTPENGFGYDYLPKLDDGQDASVMSMIDAMYAGKIKGLTCVGQNPACSLPNSNKVRKALQNLDWMVHVNIFDNETASFWKGPGLDPKKVKTECFLLPVTASVEKEGSQANSGRWMQWKYAAAEGPGDAISTGDVFWRVMSRLKELYAKDGGTFPEPILAANTDFVDGKGRYDPERVAKYINGYFLKDVTINGVEYKKGECVPGFPLLQADGSTSCGNWICSGSFTRAGENLMKRRKKVDPTGLGLYPEWSYSWPVNRRVIYNRASVDPQGKPWNPKKALVQWKDGQWIGDVPDPAAGHAGRQAAVHHAAGGPRRPVRPGTGRRPVPGTLRADGKPLQEEHHVRPAGQPGPPYLRQGHEPDRQRIARLPAGDDHVLLHRTLVHGRVHPLAAVARRSPAPGVCGDQRGAGKGKGHCQRGKGPHLLGARYGRRRGDGHGAPHALQVRRQNRASGGYDLQLRLAAAQGMRRHGKPAQSHGR